MTPSCLPSDGASTKSRGNHNALKALLVTAPAALREQLRGRSAAMLVRQAAALEPGPLDTPTAAAKFALRCLARRYQALHAEVATLDTELKRLTAKAAPGLVARLRWHQPTKDSMARRLKEGKTTKEIIRCLKRYVARELFTVLNQTVPTPAT